MLEKKFLGGYDIFMYPNVFTIKECQEYIDYFDSEYSKKQETNSELIDGIKLDIPIENNSTGIDQHKVNTLNNKFKYLTEHAHNISAKLTTMHGLIWQTESFGNYHSDNSDIDGNDIGASQYKFSTILYLNDDYLGGEILFRDHDLSIKLNAGSILSFPGGIKNIHRINRVAEGKRYNIVSFFDVN